WGGWKPAWRCLPVRDRRKPLLRLSRLECWSESIFSDRPAGKSCHMTPEKLNVLLGFLGRLPAPLAARLANAVEADRLSEHGALPHDLILEGLRSALRDAHSGRIPGPLRLFSRPFEDLLSNKPRTQKQKGRIARASIVPVWQWISGTLLPQQAAAFVAETR